jgi:hypothetical protein
MRFLVDECVGTSVAEYLKSNNHIVFSVFDELEELMTMTCYRKVS